MTPDRDLVREFLTAEFQEPEPKGDIRLQRAPYEGVANSPAICTGCGFSLSEPGRCPKCGCLTREIATAFVRRDLSELLRKHELNQSAIETSHCKTAKPGSPLAIARASEYPRGSKEYARIYHQAFLAAQKKG